MMDLDHLLSQVQAPSYIRKEIYSWKIPDLQGEVCRNPFILKRARGMGFKRCDKIRRALGLNSDMPARLTAAVEEVFEQRPETAWLHAADLTQGVANTLGKPQEEVMSILSLKDSPFHRRGSYFATELAAQQEYQAALSLCECASNKSNIPTMKVWSDVLTSHQIKRLHKAIHGSRIGFLLGGPGTGKTLSAVLLAKQLLQTGLSVSVATPTGKAAQRFSELARKCDANVHAKTIHSLLRLSPTLPNQTPHPVIADLLIIDEASMLDTWLFNQIMQATKNAVLFVGDPHQLPPISRGRLLYEVQKLGKNGLLNVGELKEAHRSSAGSAIMRAAMQINEGEEPKIMSVVRPRLDDGPNLQLLPSTNDNFQHLLIMGFYHYIIKDRLDIDPTWDVQTLVSINKGSCVAREELNTSLQALLNPNGRVLISGFREKDKVMCTSNLQAPMLFPTIGGKTRPVANGDMGHIVSNKGRKLYVQLRDAPGTRVLLTPSTITLAYAITVHKGQGSEWPIVFTILPTGNAMAVAGREWLVTATTRASRLSILCGSRDTISKLVRNRAVLKRKSFVAEMVKEEMESRGSRQSVV